MDDLKNIEILFRQKIDNFYINDQDSDKILEYDQNRHNVLECSINGQNKSDYNIIHEDFFKLLKLLIILKFELLKNCKNYQEIIQKGKSRMLYYLETEIKNLNRHCDELISNLYKNLKNKGKIHLFLKKSKNFSNRNIILSDPIYLFTNDTYKPQKTLLAKRKPEKYFPGRSDFEIEGSNFFFNFLRNDLFL